MPILVKRVFTRPNTSVPFYTRTPEYDAYMQGTYDATGHRLSVTTTVSADELVKTVEATWALDYAFFAGTSSDVMIQTHLLAMEMYNSTNGITMTQAVIDY